MGGIIVLKDEPEIFWQASNFIFGDVMEEAMKEVSEGSETYQTLIRAKVNGLLYVEHLEKQDREKLLRSVIRLLDEQKERLSNTAQEDEAFPYVRGRLNKLEELIAKIGEVPST